MKPKYTPLAVVYKFLLYPLRVLYVRVFRPRELGVRCLIEYEGKVLLVRNTYGSMEWNMPGGSVDDGESPEKASRREAREEVGLNLTGLQPVGRRGTTYYFYGEAHTPKLEIARAEIYNAGWFDWGNLPRPLSSEVKRVKKLHRVISKS